MKALKKALLELLRIMVIAAIPVLISSLQNGSLDWQAVAVASIIAGLRFVDKWLHELGKEENIEQLVKGLVRF